MYEVVANDNAGEIDFNTNINRFEFKFKVNHISSVTVMVFAGFHL